MKISHFEINWKQFIIILKLFGRNDNIFVLVHEFMKILLLSETRRRRTCMVRDRNIWSETDIPARRPTCLIEDQSETDILGWRPIEDINACGDPSEIDMPAELYNLCFVFILEKCKVSDQACLSPILHVSLRSCMYVSLRPNISVVSNGFPIGLR